MELTQEQLAKMTPDHPLLKVIERMTEVEKRLNAADPEISTHLKAIHEQLRDYEDLAHLLTPKQIGVLMAGLQKHTAISLVVEGSKSKAKSKKVTVGDLL